MPLTLIHSGLQNVCSMFEGVQKDTHTDAHIYAPVAAALNAP